jgi:hypothetical protein
MSKKMLGKIHQSKWLDEWLETVRDARQLQREEFAKEMARNSITKVVTGLVAWIKSQLK